VSEIVDKCFARFENSVWHLLRVFLKIFFYVQKPSAPIYTKVYTEKEFHDPAEILLAHHDSGVWHFLGYMMSAHLWWWGSFIGKERETNAFTEYPFVSSLLTGDAVIAFFRDRNRNSSVEGVRYWSTVAALGRKSFANPTFSTASETVLCWRVGLGIFTPRNMPENFWCQISCDAINFWSSR